MVAAPTPTAPASDTIPGAPAEPPPIERLVDPAAFVGRHVLVPAGAALAIAASEDAVALRLRTAGSRDPIAFAFAVTGTKDGWLQLVAAAPEHRCDDGLVGLDWIAPTWYVRPDALAPVLARETTVRFVDGTSLVLRAGAAIERSGDDGIVDLGGMRLHAAIAERDVGNAYTPAMPRPPVVVSARVPHSTRLHYGEHVSEPPYRWWTGESGDLVALSRDDVDGRARVEVANACASMRAFAGEIRFDPSEIERVRRGSIAIALGGNAAHSEIAAGTAATWVDGTPAGTVARAQEFTGAGTRRKGRKCFEVGDADTRFDPIELCFAVKGVTYVDPLGPLLAELGALEDSTTLSLLGAPAPRDLADLVGSGSSDEVRGPSVGGAGPSGIGGGGALGGLGLDTPRHRHVTVTLAHWLRTGALEERQVEFGLTRMRHAIRRCADTDLDVGTLTIAFELGTGGTPTDISVSGIDALATCVRDGVAASRFAEADDTTTVEATYELTN